jgi:hypothetical protein
MVKPVYPPTTLLRGYKSEGWRWQTSTGHENILGLIDLILTLPASSANAERGFSKMKMTKTDWQTCLRNSVLNDILMVHFNTASVKDWSISCHSPMEFWGTKTRRPCFRTISMRTRWQRRRWLHWKKIIPRKHSECSILHAPGLVKGKKD